MAERTFATLIATWEVSQAYKALRPKSQRGYRQCAKELMEWSKQKGHPDPTNITQPRAEEFLTAFDNRPTQRRHVRNVFKLVMDQAIALGWRSDNPVEKIKSIVPESRVEIWEQADVERYAWAAALSGQSSVAALIFVEWELGQRLTDARLFRHGAEWSDNEGVFRFWQSKTNSYVTIPVSERARWMITTARVDGSLYLFTDATTGKPYSESRLAHLFEQIRDRVRGADERTLVLRALRHSCVVQLARSGCTVPEIASITGHSIGSVESILSRYLPRDNEVAWNAQRKRGLVA